MKNKTFFSKPLISPEYESAPTNSEAVINSKAEDADCANMWLDDLKVPTHDEGGNKYSLVGRIIQYAKMAEHQNYSLGK